MKPRNVARLGDRSHPSMAPSITASSNVLVNGRPALREGDAGVGGWLAEEGATHVLVNNRRLHRIRDGHSSSCAFEGSIDTIAGVCNIEDAPTTGLDAQLELHFKAFIPNTLNFPEAPWFDTPNPFDDLVLGASEGAVAVSRTQYRGDGRGFFEPGTSRLHSSAIVKITNGVVSGVEKVPPIVGESHVRVVENGFAANKFWTREFEKTDTAKLGTSNTMATDVRMGKRSVRVRFDASVGIPFSALAPHIDYSAEFVVIVAGPHLVRVLLGGTHDEFPGYEAYVIHAGKPENLWSYDPARHDYKLLSWASPSKGPGAINLSSPSPIDGPEKSRVYERIGMAGRSIVKGFSVYDIQFP